MTKTSVDASIPLLRVDNLRTYFDSPVGQIKAVDGVSFDVNRGETLCLVGESGSGKSVTAFSIMNLIPKPPGRIAGGRILFKGEDLLIKSEAELRKIRGNKIAMIFQEPMTALNPVYSIGDQISEVIQLHQGLSRRQAWALSGEMLDVVGISDPSKRLLNFPHELSGGMRQRAMIAIALTCQPDLLIADEPTTALDVTIQAQILELIRKLQAQIGMAVIFITHDLGVVAEIADRVVVMYAGRTVEEAACASLFSKPRMPYTKGLLASVPRIDRAPLRSGQMNAIPGSPPNLAKLPAGCVFEPRCAYSRIDCLTVAPELEEDGSHKVRCLHWRRLGDASVGTRAAEPIVTVPVVEQRSSLLEVSGLSKSFEVRPRLFSRGKQAVRAVHNVSFSVGRGEVVALVGESGAGKSTVGRAVLRLIEPSAGTVTFDGVDVTRLSRSALRRFRKNMQIVFQDPFSSLNPRMKVGQSISEAMLLHGLADRRTVHDRIAELFTQVGLAPAHAERHPHEFSGGQRQRIGIARALAVEPQLIVADEALSALDVSIRAQILNLFAEIRRRLDLAMLFISHDLSVVRSIADRVIVMYLGRVMEVASVRDLYERPGHPYTEALLSAVPIPDPAVRPTRTILSGEIPSPISPPSGCVFRTRCPMATADCARIEPILKQVSPGRFSACLYAESRDFETASISPAGSAGGPSRIMLAGEHR